jgi:hypothetical protein
LENRNAPHVDSRRSTRARSCRSQQALATHVTPTPCDFFTGGGYVFKDDGQMANYGVHAGCKNGEFWGHINYVDHGLGLHVRSTEITLYVRESLADGTVLENTRDFCGKAIVNEDTENPRWFPSRSPTTASPAAEATSSGSLSTACSNTSEPGSTW